MMAEGEVTVRPARNSALDGLRILATCAVVLLHTMTGAMNLSDASTALGYREALLTLRDLVTFSVPVFLMISGYLFLNPEKEITYPQMLRRYCLRIVLAILLFGIPYALAELVMTAGSFSPDMLLQAIWLTLTGRTWAHMWYLYTILLLYLLTPAIKWLLAKLPNALWVLALALLVLFSSIAPMCNMVTESSTLPELPGVMIYAFYYIVGYYFVAWERTENEYLGRAAANRLRNEIFCLVGATLLLAAGIICSRRLGFELQMGYNYPLTLAFSLLIFMLTLCIGRVRTAQETKERQAGAARRKSLGDLCFGIYLIHPVFINLAYKLWELSPLRLVPENGQGGAMNLLPLAVLVGFAAAVLVASALCTWALRKVPVLRKHVL